MEVIKLGDRLRQARTRARMTQCELGKRMQVSGVAVSYWENGANEPSIDHLKRLCDTLDITLDWLCFGDAKSGGYIDCGRMTPGVEQTLLATIGAWPVEQLKQFSRAVSDLLEAA